jgi:phosphatidylinositol alpha-1,6-mannosyltransferase
VRWLIVADDFPPADGGVSTWGGLVADGLHAAGHEVTVLARARPGLGGRPYPVVGVRGPSFGAWGGLWTAAASLGRRADRVLATTWPVATGLARWRTDLDVVVHGSDVTRPQGPGLDRVLRGARRFATSRFLAEALAARGYDATVLPAPIDAGPPRSRGPERPARWGFLGRATDLKGGDRFVRLVGAVGATGVVIGDGPALGAWRDEASRRELDVRFLGRLDRSEALREVATWDLAFLLPRADADGSGAEGFGLSLVEAAAQGVATVGSRTGGVPEAVGAGLVLDDPDYLPRAVAGILSWWTPDRGEACRAFVAAHHGLARTLAALGA